jgi:hypothetical protein
MKRKKFRNFLMDRLVLKTMAEGSLEVQYQAAKPHSQRVED